MIFYFYKNNKLMYMKKLKNYKEIFLGFCPIKKDK